MSRDGLVAFLVGKVTVDKAVWNCSFPGTVFDMNQSSIFFTVSFSFCKLGSYSVGAASSLLGQREW